MDWHPFAERFPLLEGEEWETFKASIKRTKGNKQPVSFRTVKGKKQGLDGRNRERACDELGLKCHYFEECVSDDEVKEFILDANVHRRHMTKELRREIVAELRSDGKSTRAIADVIGVSPQTVVNDLKSSGVQKLTPEKVTGTDGKQYPSTNNWRANLPAPKSHPLTGTTHRNGKPEEPKPTSSRDNGRMFDGREFGNVYGPLVRLVDDYRKRYGHAKEYDQMKSHLQSLIELFETWSGVKAK